MSSGNPNNNHVNGQEGEDLVSRFFGREFSNIISFPSPRTADGAQVADILIWQNRQVYLIEVKTRTEGTAPIENWARNRIQKGVEQIIGNYDRIQNQEIINLHNDYYHLPLQYEGIEQVIGIVVLVHDEDLSIIPSDVVPDIYRKALPIHVFSLSNLQQVTGEIDTIMDLSYYLNDRFAYLKTSDIPLCSELEPVGYYKSHNYQFPHRQVDFNSTTYWEDYLNEFAHQIVARDHENQAGGWLDHLATVFTEPRRFYDGLPLGLYLAWEAGSLPRRARTIIGERMNQVQQWFTEGHTSRKFAFHNLTTYNWWVFFYLRGNNIQVQKELERLVRLKLIQLVHDNNFEYAVYGFGFQVSLIEPPQLMGMPAVEFNADENILRGNFTQQDVEDAHQYWGGNTEIDIQEFPDV